MAGKIMYCAIPTRFTKSENWEEIREKIIKIAVRWGYAPVIPFDIGDYEYFEGGTIGRERTIAFMIHVMRFCDAVGIFGISDGVMGEFRDTIDNPEKEIRVCLDLDEDWEKYYEDLKPKYGDLFARLRGPNHLIALVGPRAIGKTFWSERLLKIFHWKLKRVKNTTTRKPRDEKDHESYHFVSREEFEEGIRENRFLEYDQYQGNYYGSSFEEIKKVLEKNSGIFAITPAGAKALYERRFEINLKIIRLVPKTERVLKENFKIRKINDPAEQRKLLGEAKTFVLPDDMEHDLVMLSRHTDIDEENILKIVDSMFNKKTAH